jgi:hypothetical protein
MMILNYKKAFQMLCVAAALSPALFSCSDKTNDDPIDPSPAKKSGYVFSLRAQGDAESSADYVWKFDSLAQLMTGEISVVGKGIEQPGWCYYFGLSNTLFSINYGDEGTKGYTFDATGKISEKGQFYVDRLDCMGVANDSMLIGVGAPWGGGSIESEFMIINSNKVSITNRKFHPFYQMNGKDTLNRWPTGAIVRDNKIFVPFYPLHGVTWDTPIMDTAYVNIYDYPSLNYVSTIKDSRTAPIGTYGSIPSIIKVDNGDIYAISTASYAAGYTKLGKPSGILRIKNGQSTFDPDYFFNFESSTVQGKLMSVFNIGNGKALVRYFPKALDAPAIQWAGLMHYAPLCKLAIVDLANKTITPVTSLPDHGGEYGGQLLVENGKAYKCITSATETRIYAIDLTTGVAQKGALVKGLEMPAIYKVTY